MGDSEDSMKQNYYYTIPLNLDHTPKHFTDLFRALVIMDPDYAVVQSTNIANVDILAVFRINREDNLAILLAHKSIQGGELSEMKANMGSPPPLLQTLIDARDAIPVE